MLYVHMHAATWLAQVAQVRVVKPYMYDMLQKAHNVSIVKAVARSSQLVKPRLTL